MDTNELRKAVFIKSGEEVRDLVIRAADEIDRLRIEIKVMECKLDNFLFETGE